MQNSFNLGHFKLKIPYKCNFFLLKSYFTGEIALTSQRAPAIYYSLTLEYGGLVGSWKHPFDVGRDCLPHVLGSSQPAVGEAVKENECSIML